MDKRALRVQSPCSFDWTQMTPADKGRFCAQCKKVVHDLSRMTERDARTLLSQERNEELCVRFVYDQQGKVFFGGDRPPLVPAALLHRAKRAALATAALVALEGCAVDASPLDALSSGKHGPRNPDAPIPSQEYTSTTGGVAYDPSMDPPLFADDAGSGDGAADAANRDGSSARADGASDAGPDSAL